MKLNFRDKTIKPVGENNQILYLILLIIKCLTKIVNIKLISLRTKYVYVIDINYDKYIKVALINLDESL